MLEQLGQLARVVDPPPHLLVRLGPPVQRFDFLDGLAGGIGVVPEAGLGHRGFEDGLPGYLGFDVKDSP